MTHQTDAVELTDQQLVERLEQLRCGVEDGELPVWTGDEPLAEYLARARSLGR